MPLRGCPKSNRSGNCANCDLVERGGSPRFNRFGIRELRDPPIIEFNANGDPLRQPRSPLPLQLIGEMGLGEEFQVLTTTHAAEVRSYKGQPLGPETRRAAPLFMFVREKGGSQPPEQPAEILAHLLQFAHRPVITWEYPVTGRGATLEKVDPIVLKAQIEARKRDWDKDIIFPQDTCCVPRLHLTDLAGLENVRRFAVQHGVGVVLTGATLLQHDMDVLRAVWPELATREHPYPTRKIKQLAVVIVKESAGLRSVLTSENRLVTAPLERFDGLGLLFCSRRKIATSLFEAVCLTQPTARLAVENYEQMQCRKTVHHLADPKTYITYSRGVLGLGANLLNVRHVLADANAFRKLAAFTPGILGPEAFARARAEERTALILQNLGRALRGEEGKTAVLFLLNTDGHLLKVLKDSAALREGAELPIVWAQGDNLTQLVDQAERWLEADGGEWPGEDPRKDRKRGRPKSSAIRTREQILEAAEWALAEGMSWRDFSRKEHPQRHLTADELEALKARFGARNANNPEPTTGAGPGSDGDSACSP